jgi:hypothetical protein
VGDKMWLIMMDSKSLCGTPSVMGAIDGIHINITKLVVNFSKDYYYHKNGGYNIVAQAIVDNYKRFLNVYVRLARNVNCSCVLRKSKLYQCAQHGVYLTWLLSHKMECFHIFLVTKDTHYFPRSRHHIKEEGEHNSILELLYNHKHNLRWRSIVDNAFGILKQTFK